MARYSARRKIPTISNARSAAPPGGSAASVSANFCHGRRRPGRALRRSAGRRSWNCVVGMRPTAGLVSRGGVYAGWPSINGSLGPMARTVTDLAKLLDVMVGYDPDDPVTAHGVGHVPDSYTKFLDANGTERRAHRHSARVHGLRLRARLGRLQQDHRGVRQGGGRAESRRAPRSSIRSSSPNLKALLAKRAGELRRRRRILQGVLRPQRQSALRVARGSAWRRRTFAKVVTGSRERWIAHRRCRANITST